MANPIETDVVKYCPKTIPLKNLLLFTAKLKHLSVVFSLLCIHLIPYNFLVVFNASNQHHIVFRFRRRRVFQSS
jgi:hypothetical protein